MEITWEQLPKVVGQLYEKFSSFEKLLMERHSPPLPEADELLTVQDAAKFLRLSVPTIYGLISKGDLPVMKRSKRCYFSKIDLLNYLKEGRRRTSAEIAAEADSYFQSKKKRG